MKMIWVLENCTQMQAIQLSQEIRHGQVLGWGKNAEL